MSLPYSPTTQVQILTLLNVPGIGEISRNVFPLGETFFLVQTFYKIIILPLLPKQAPSNSNHSPLILAHFPAPVSLSGDLRGGGRGSEPLDSTPIYSRSF